MEIQQTNFFFYLSFLIPVTLEMNFDVEFEIKAEVLFEYSAKCFVVLLSSFLILTLSRMPTFK